MADLENVPADTADAPPAGMREPTPVFDVTYQHIYSGQVFRQFYVFLWVSVAIVLGCVLSWRAAASGGGSTIFQAILLVCAIGCLWTCIANVKSRRLTFWPILAVEILASLFLYFHYDYTVDQSNIVRDEHILAIDKQIQNVGIEFAGQPAAERARDKELRMERQLVLELSDWDFSDLLIGGFTSWRAHAGGSDKVQARRKFEHAWDQFGTGFHLCWITCGFLLLFIIGSVVFAVITAKPKEDPKLARRRSRTDKKADGDVATGDAGPAAS